MVKDFEIVHDEKVHLVIVRDGLDHFAHIHPAADAKGNLDGKAHCVPLVGGKYRLIADWFHHQVEQVMRRPLGSGLYWRRVSLPVCRLLRISPGEMGGSRQSVRLLLWALLKVDEPPLSFVVRNDEGPAKLEPYMGALGHPDVRRRRRELRPCPPVPRG